MRLPALVVAVVLLEAASGLPFGVVNDLVPLWLRAERGTDLGALGALTLVGLPWTFKALAGPFVDRHGTFRAWMVGGLVGCIVGAGLLPHVPDMRLLVGLMVAVAVCSAIQDVAIDGWLVGAVPAEQQGRVTGFRIAGYRVAMALAGGGAAVVGERLGWDRAFLVGAALMACLLFVQLRLPEPQRHAKTDAADWLGTLRAWITEPGVGMLFLFVLLYRLGDSAMAPMVKPYLLDAGLGAGEVGLLSSTAGAVLVSLGAVLGGDFTSRFGLREGLWALGALQALSNLGYAVAASLGGRAPAYVASIAESFTGGLGAAALLTLVMRASTGAQMATRFALLTSMVGLTRSLAGAISGFAVERVGYAGWFAFTFALALPALLLVRRVARPAAA
ncbi:MAG: MFS transporter [Myxococcota bacterium]